MPDSDSPIPKSGAIAIRKVFEAQIKKWGGVLVLFACAAFFGWIATIPFLEWFGSTPRMEAEAKVVWGLLFAGFAAVSGWYGWRAIKEPAVRVPRASRASDSLAEEFRNVFNLEQLEMAAHMEKLRQAGHFAEAAMLVERLLPVVTDHDSGLYVHLLLIEVDCLLRQNQIDQAEKICADYVQENVNNEQKLMILDGCASYILYQSSAAHFARAEKFSRIGLQMAPANLTLKGTLGSLLVEQGNYPEGEALLNECLQQSQALIDQAISSFYLGVIKIRTGQTKEGKRLIKWAMRMYPEPWMTAKGRAILKEARPRKT